MKRIRQEYFEINHKLPDTWIEKEQRFAGEIFIRFLNFFYKLFGWLK